MIKLRIISRSQFVRLLSSLAVVCVSFHLPNRVWPEWTCRVVFSFQTSDFHVARVHLRDISETKNCLCSVKTDEAEDKEDSQPLAQGYSAGNQKTERNVTCSWIDQSEQNLISKARCRPAPLHDRLVAILRLFPPGRCSSPTHPRCRTSTRRLREVPCTPRHQEVSNWLLIYTFSLIASLCCRFRVPTLVSILRGMKTCVSYDHLRDIFFTLTNPNKEQ